MNASTLSLPKDLSRLTVEELGRLAEDIRQVILSACLRNGGHLGASLGTVELGIALHRMFRSPEEAILWDVGHQAYVHKLLTGRWERFQTLRTAGGISGFLSRDESEHDVFGAGHSSTSLSAALGIAWARGPESPHWTVAVIGDGGLTAGLALEALNNVRGTALGPLLIVLNDNQMSIAPNVGAVSSILTEGEGQSFFRHFGLDYLGPIDGHDLPVLLGTLNGIRQGYAGRPIVLHVMTQKGRGYAPAEDRPATYHGIGPMQAKVSPEISAAPAPRSYSQEFGHTLCRLAEADPRIVAITAAMPEGTGLSEFAVRFPHRFFDVGIAEGHAVTFAAALATQGLKPVVAIYSTFLQRALDSVIHDTALQRLGVTFAIDRAGVVGADGPTHHGAFDLAYLGMIPGMTVTSPEVLSDLSRLLEQGVSSGAPFAIRYPRGSGPESSSVPLSGPLRWHIRAEKPRLIVVALGPASSRLTKVMTQFRDTGAPLTWVSTLYAKPVPAELVTYLSSHPQAALVTIEDGSIRGGFGEHLGAVRGASLSHLRNLGYGDQFISHGGVYELEKSQGLDSANIHSVLAALLS